jgi:hypothetical protein
MQTTEKTVVDTADKNLFLEPRLAKQRAFWGSKLTEEENATMERHIEFLRETGAVNNILKGDTAPALNLNNQRVKLSHLPNF